METGSADDEVKPEYWKNENVGILGTTISKKHKKRTHYRDNKNKYRVLNPRHTYLFPSYKKGYNYKTILYPTSESTCRI